MRRLRVELERILRGKKGVLPSLFRLTMTPFSWIYAVVIWLRNLYYDSVGGRQTALPVISIGNVIAGGTGKSDLVTALAQLIPQKVAIVTRGYGVKIKEPFVVQRQHDASICGDEPRMIADRLPEHLVIVGPNRFKGVELAQKEGAKLIILDDGMQHRQLHRNFEIAMNTTSQNFLPKGLLRDDPKRLKRADLVVAIDEKLAPNEALVRSKIEGIFTLDGEKIETIQGETVALFCAIANPNRFVKTVEELGAKIVKKLLFPDHMRLCEKKLSQFLQSSDAKYLICTEKDKVKLKSKLPILWVKRSLKIDENDQSWQNALTKVRKML
ncbi:MAG: Tetraacyldisaccharide 4'-kinase [Chlamydiales bacterium]|nr:Tetraacyldisaccharide 4'-kinase [Chlamydiales bacterium]MCH9635611.1 Tetraacyldisaccharide 4'-kinase [Chlamydiales bacterium]MCH9704069.1 tetraacyldisaccharide 4'-kinase [Chlamydiota bacterium]